MRWGVLLLGVIGCSSDPTLEVTVQHPTGPTIVSTVVSVFNASGLGAAPCQAYELGDLSTDQLAATLVATETITTGAATTGNLDGLPRTDPKLVVAQGFGADGKLLTVGCVDEGVVNGAATVTVTTNIAAIVSVDSVAAIDSTRATDTTGFQVNVIDPTSGQPIAGRAVTWRVYGPSGTTAGKPDGTVSDSDGTWAAANPTCSDANGAAIVHPTPPNVTAGYAVRVQVAWQRDAIPLTSSINAQVPAATTLTGTQSHPCALGRTGTSARIVCATSATVATIYNPTHTTPSSLTLAPETPTVSIADTGHTLLGLFSVPTTGTDLGVYAIYNNGDLVPAYGGLPAVSGTCTLANPCGTDALVLPACGAGSTTILYSNAGGIMAEDPTTGNSIVLNGTTANMSLNAAGCATVLDRQGNMTLTQMIVIDATPAGGVPAFTAAIYKCGTSACVAQMPIAGARVGFDTIASTLLVPTIDDATAWMASMYVAEPPSTGALAQLVELDRSQALAIPDQIAAGRFDALGDGKIWTTASRGGSIAELAYTDLAEGAPLEAIANVVGQFGASTLGTTVNTSDLIVGDLDGDGYDDLVFAGTGALSLATQVVAIPVHAPADTSKYVVDMPAACSL